MVKSMLLVALLAYLSCAHAALPTGWKACKRSAPDYDTCFVREVMKAVSTLMDGDKKLGVHSLDPLRIQKLEIPQRSGPVSINLAFKNFDLVGIKDIQLNSAKNDWKTVKATAYIPNLQALGDYKVNGKVLVLPIQGDGKCNITLENLTLDINVVWKQNENNGKKYFQMKTFDLDLKPKRVYFKLENLFNGDKALGDNMNVFLNENWDQIMEELKPALSQALSQAFIQISNRVLSKVPANEIDLK